MAYHVQLPQDYSHPRSKAGRHLCFKVLFQREGPYCEKWQAGVQGDKILQMRWAVRQCYPLCCQPNSNQNFCTIPMLTELVLNTLPVLQKKGTAYFKKLLSRSQCVSLLYYSGIFPDVTSTMCVLPAALPSLWLWHRTPIPSCCLAAVGGQVDGELSTPGSGHGCFVAAWHTSVCDSSSSAPKPLVGLSQTNTIRKHHGKPVTQLRGVCTKHCEISGK